MKENEAAILAAENVMIMNGQAVVKTYYLLMSRLTFGIHSVLISNISMKSKPSFISFLRSFSLSSTCMMRVLMWQQKHMPLLSRTRKKQLTEIMAQRRFP